MTLTKIELRAELRTRRRMLAAAHPDAADRAAGHLPLVGVHVAAGYHPLGGEIDPGPVLRRLEAAGARIALPVCLHPRQPLVFRAWRQGDPLAPDAAKVPAPVEAAEVLVPDLLLVPLLAFDRAGYRLGQGAGYYDRTLAQLREHGMVLAVGLAYAGQEVAEVPREDHDEPLDAILTETGYHAVSKSG